MPLSPITPAVFCTPRDRPGTSVAAPARAIAGPTLAVLDASVFGTPSPSAPVRITIADPSTGAVKLHLKATAASGNVLTVAPMDGFADVAVLVGDLASVTASSAMISDIHAAIGVDEAAINAAATAVNANTSGIAAHLADAANPHAVTKAQVGLGNADNTSDVNKPLSTADTTALGLKLAIASNLSDLTSAATARTNLGLGSAATHPATDFGTPLPSTAALLKGDGAGGAVAAVAGTDYPGLATANIFAGANTFAATQTFDLAANPSNYVARTVPQHDAGYPVSYVDGAFSNANSGGGASTYNTVHFRGWNAGPGALDPSYGYWSEGMESHWWNGADYQFEWYLTAGGLPGQGGSTIRPFSVAVTKAGLKAGCAMQVSAWDIEDEAGNAGMSWSDDTAGTITFAMMNRNVVTFNFVSDPTTDRLNFGRGDHSASLAINGGPNPNRPPQLKLQKAGVTKAFWSSDNADNVVFGCTHGVIAYTRDQVGPYHEFVVPVIVGGGIFATDPAASVLSIQAADGQTALMMPFRGVSSTAAVRDTALIDAGFLPGAGTTDATRTGYLDLYAADWTGVNKKGLRVESDGTQAIVRLSGMVTSPPASPTPGTGYSERIGVRALNANTTGDYNAAFGFEALKANTTGNFNAGFGFGAVGANTGGSQNSGLGFAVLGALASGSGNTGVGAFALSAIAGANSNTAIGANADQTKTAGGGCTAIGQGASSGNFDNVVVIGYGATATATDQVVIGSGNQTLVIPGLPAAIAPTYAPAISLPADLHAVVGHECNLYFDNLLRLPFGYRGLLDLAVTCGIGAQQEERWTVTPAGGDVGDHALTLAVSWGGIAVASASATLHVKAATAAGPVARKILAIGDSTTAGGQWLAELTNLCNFNRTSPTPGGGADNLTLTTIGTIAVTVNDAGGTARTVHHEAIAGQTVNWFATDAASPFVNAGAFDFAHYLAANSIAMASGDWVLIHLGINDFLPITTDAAATTLAATAGAQIDAMIASIRAAVAGARIGLMTTIPPASTQDPHQVALPSNRARYRRSHDLWVEAMIARFSGRTSSGVYLVPVHTNLDTYWSMQYDAVTPSARMPNTTIIRLRDFVHPEITGTHQMADAVHTFLRGQES